MSILNVLRIKFKPHHEDSATSKQFLMKEKIFLIFCILIFVLFSTPCIKHPISYPDENVVLVNSASIINKNFPLLPTPSIRFGNKNLPLLFCPYDGNSEFYLYLPFLYLFGINHISSHIAAIFYSILTIIFTFYFLRDFFNKRIAFISTFLLVTNLTFILGTRLAIFTGSITSTIAMGSLFYFWKWYKKRNILFFYLGLFLLGLGLNTRGWFVCFINAIIFSSLYYRKELKIIILKKKDNIFFKYFILGPIFFCIGAFPILYYNLTSHFSTIAPLFYNFPITYRGVNNLDYFNNLLVRIRHSIQLFNGEFLLHHIALTSIYQNKIIFWTNNLYPSVILMSLLWLVFSICLLKDIFRKKRFFLLIIIILIFLQSPFTISNLSAQHLFILLPFIQIVIALSLFDLLYISKRFFLKTTAIGIIFMLILVDLILISNKYLCLNKMGGRGDESDAIYELINWLNKEGYKEPVLLDFHLKPMLLLLSESNISAKEFFVYGELNLENFYYFYKKLIDNFKTKDNIYISHTPEFSASHYYDVFRGIIQKSGKHIIYRKLFYQKDGVAVYRVVAIE